MSDKIPCIIEIPDNGTIRTFHGLFERPSMSAEIIEIPYGYGHECFYTQGRTKWSNVELKFYEHYNTEEFKFLLEWVNEMCNVITGRIGYVHDCKRDIIVSSLNESGFVQDKWILQGTFIVSYRTKICEYNACKNIISNKLTRKVLFEKINHPTMQIAMIIELSIDIATLE